MTRSAEESKLRGGYYTPEVIADYLARWATAEPPVPPYACERTQQGRHGTLWNAQHKASGPK